MAERGTRRRSPKPALSLNRLAPATGAAVDGETGEAGVPSYRTWEDLYRQEWRMARALPRSSAWWLAPPDTR